MLVAVSRSTADEADWFMLKLTQVLLQAMGLPPMVQPASSRAQLLHVLVRQYAYV